eukprot:m.254220 g.254220  ORF g.254220 m.254220 type:complete len:174 (+) comp18858_c0_seq1:70-591(+)
MGSPSVASLALLLALALTAGALAKPTEAGEQVWRVRRQVVSARHGDVTLLLFDYDGSRVTEEDSHLVLSSLAQQLSNAGLSAKVPMAVSLEQSNIRVAVRDPHAAARILTAVSEGRIQPPPLPPGSSRRALITEIAGAGVALVAVAGVVLAVLRRKSSGDSDSASKRRDSLLP